MQEDADVFVWLGDVIYSARPYLSTSGWKYDASITPVDAADYPVDSDKPGQLKWLYSYQKQHPGYSRLINSRTEIFGTWDDHDFGQNDADDRFPFKKKESQEAFLDFLDV